MPELPEVRTVCRYLNRFVINKEIKSVDINLPKIIKNVEINFFKKVVKGRKILKIFNVGKWILFDIGDDYKIVIHLRLEGKFRNVLEGFDRKHDLFIFNFKDNTKLYYNDTRQFGTFHLLKGEYLNQDPLAKLAKEPQETDLNWLFEKLSKKRIAIKTALLDQTILVGLGNIYVNEVLWKEKINPEKPSNQVSKKQLAKVLKTAYEIMEKSFELGGSSINSYVALNQQKGEFQNFLNVHTKYRKPCPRCKTIILKKQVNGRGTYYCPKCQK